MAFFIVFAFAAIPITCVFETFANRINPRNAVNVSSPCAIIANASGRNLYKQWLELMMIIFRTSAHLANSAHPFGLHTGNSGASKCRCTSSATASGLSSIIEQIDAKEKT